MALPPVSASTASAPPADAAAAASSRRSLRWYVAAAVFCSSASVGAAATLIGLEGAAGLVQIGAAAAALAVLAALALDRIGPKLDPGAGSDGLARELAAARAELSGLALKDALTGQMNATAFNERLGAELRRAQREGYRVAVVALGIDHFKRINEGWGRAAGDEALQLVAERIATELRPSDLCGRIGGDEFMVALVQTGGGDADEVVNRVRHAIASVEFTPTGETLTASAGFAVFPYDAADVETLTRLAELALRRSKLGGRDRATAHSDYTDAEGDGRRLPPARI